MLAVFAGAKKLGGMRGRLEKGFFVSLSDDEARDGVSLVL